MTITLIPKKYTISMLTFFSALCTGKLNSPFSKLSGSAIIDHAEIVSADLQRTNVGNMTKLTITSIPQIYNEHAHLLPYPDLFMVKVISWDC